MVCLFFFFFQAEDGIRDRNVTGVQTCALPISDESQMDAVTAISGSGPAYVFYFIEAVEDAARELGLPVQIAHQLVLNTFTGAAKIGRASCRERVEVSGGEVAWNEKRA